MSRLQIELPDSVVESLQRRAEERGMSVAEYIREILEQEALEEWPSEFFQRVAGGWKGEPLKRPPQGAL
ncbi:MAG: CopG family transcriptional regulator, partial [Bradymonadaceae bacterium]